MLLSRLLCAAAALTACERRVPELRVEDIRPRVAEYVARQSPGEEVPYLTVACQEGSSCDDCGKQWTRGSVFVAAGFIAYSCDGGMVTIAKTATGEKEIGAGWLHYAEGGDVEKIDVLSQETLASAPDGTLRVTYRAKLTPLAKAARAALHCDDGAARAPECASLDERRVLDLRAQFRGRDGWFPVPMQRSGNPFSIH